ncbi:MAG: hypothetical protein JRD89_02145 [Deltaproteobacteria bacterium]|nr:hypothetical protein [Deltaproteobacteria bacterium]
MVKSIQYNSAPLNAFTVLDTTDKGKVTHLSIDGVTVVPTPRFWTSLCSTYSTYGLSTKLFKLFTHSEVFQRVTDVVGAEGKDRLRYAVEQSKGTLKLLAVTHPSKPVVEYERMEEVLVRYGAEKIEYNEGIIRSTHAPTIMDDVNIVGDAFTHQYVMETPIDGFGKPLIYLSLLRQVCSNGMIGFARAFRSEINIGRGGQTADETMFSVSRALDSFNNEEGYAALRQRFESAANSWASVYEVNRVLKVINTMAQRGMFHNPGTTPMGVIDDLATTRDAVLSSGIDSVDEAIKNPVNIKLMRAFSQMTGGLCEIYGITHLDAISQKKMSKIPARCSMYDLLNFTTETATHYCNEKDGRLLQAEVGNFISAEYDLEGTMDTHPNFSDFFTKIDDDA